MAPSDRGLFHSGRKMKLTKDKISNAVMCAQQVLKQPEIYGDDPKKLAISG